MTAQPSTSTTSLPPRYVKKPSETTLAPQPPGKIEAMPDAGYLVRNDVLERLGDGDIKRGRRTLRQMIMDVREPKRIKGPTARPESVRIATVDDEKAVFDLLVEWYREHAWNVAPLAPDMIAEQITRCTRSTPDEPMGGIVGVVDDEDGKPVGVILMVLTQWSFSKAWFIRELYTFVHPDHRKSRHAQDLVQFAKWCADEWSRQFGYQIYLVISVLTQDHIAPKIRFFRRFVTLMGAGFFYPAPSTEG